MSIIHRRSCPTPTRNRNPHRNRISTLAIIALLLLTAAGVGAQDQAAPASAAPADVRFMPVDVFIDSKDRSLAAYQFEFAVESGDVEVISIEGGEHAAFKEAPYYDPEARSRGRVIVAAFNTGTELPAGRTRVARLHVRVAGAAAETKYAVKLDVAAGSEGERIPAEAGVGSQ